MIREILLLLAAPFFIIDHCLSFLRPYRRLWGGHWERWQLGDPCHGEVWRRLPRETCYRMTGVYPGGIERSTPYCEEKGRPAYDGAVYCECGRDLSRAPGVHGSYESDYSPEDVYENYDIFCYSCPCGRWPRFHFGAPAPLYLGDQRDVA